MFVLVPVRCNELAEHMAATCAKADIARLCWWLVDGNFCQFDRHGDRNQSPAPETFTILQWYKVTKYFYLSRLFKKSFLATSTFLDAFKIRPSCAVASVYLWYEQQYNTNFFIYELILLYYVIKAVHYCLKKNLKAVNGYCCTNFFFSFATVTVFLRLTARKK